MFQVPGLNQIETRNESQNFTVPKNKKQTPLKIGRIPSTDFQGRVVSFRQGAPTCKVDPTPVSHVLVHGPFGKTFCNRLYELRAENTLTNQIVWGFSW